MLEKELIELEKKDLERTVAIANSYGLAARNPFLDPRVIGAAFQLPVEENVNSEGERKLLLRKAALELGVPATAALRPKKALQYGSGVQKALRGV